MPARSRLALPLGSRMHAICKPASGRIRHGSVTPRVKYSKLCPICRCTYYLRPRRVSPTTTNSYRMWEPLCPVRGYNSSSNLLTKFDHHQRIRQSIRQGISHGARRRHCSGTPAG